MAKQLTNAVDELYGNIQQYGSVVNILAGFYVIIPAGK
jgi:hypothetical protein